MKRFKKQLEKFIEGVLFASSTVTVITVLFIILFLFKEGLGIFNSSPIEQHYCIFVNSINPVRNIKSSQVRDIFNGKTTNWKYIGGKNDTIILLTVNECSKYYSDEQIGSNLEHCLQKLKSLFQAIREFWLISRKLYSSQCPVRKIPVSKVSIKEFILGRE